jgi:hypothetical protein
MRRPGVAEQLHVPRAYALHLEFGKVMTGMQRQWQRHLLQQRSPEPPPP